MIETIPFKPFIKEPDKYGKYVVIQQGNEPIIGYANGIPFKDYKDVIIFGDHTLSLYKSLKPFFVATDGVRIINGIDLDSYYLFYLLEKYKPKNEGYKRYFSIVTNVDCYSTKNNLEQKLIGNYFNGIDKTITITKTKVKQLKLLKKSMLEKLFQKENEVNPLVRFKGFDNDWVRCKLGEICKITMGQSPDGATYSEVPSKYILVQGNADLKDGWVEPRIWTTQKTKTAKAGDLIMSVRAPAGTIGKTAYDVVLGRGVAGLKGNEFIYQTLVKMDTDGYWKTLSTGSTFESINSDVIKNTELQLAQDRTEQDKIGQYFKYIDTIIDLHTKKVNKLKQIKKALLEKMFV